MKRILCNIIVVLLSILLPLQSMVFASGDVVKEQQSRKGMLIKYKPLQNLSSNSISLFSEEEQSQLVISADSTISNDLKTIAEDTYLMNMSDEQITSMQNDENVECIEEDSSIRMSEEKISWNVNKISAPILHNSGYYGKGIKVAVFDTGIDINNKDLNVMGGVSFVEGNNSYNDDNGHGTAMASILASLGNDDGYVGVAPEINLYSVKILDKNGEGKYSNLIQGVQWAIDNGINIIAISCGGTKYSSILKYAMNNAVNHNILVVAAAGNEGSTQINYPASYNDVICVGAVDSQNKIAPFSNTGAEMDLVAPGVGVEATCLNNLSMTIDGTSAAVPHVVGVAAQLWGTKPELSNIQMKALLYKSAVPIGERKIYGWGLVNAAIGLQCINTDLQLPIEYEYPDPNAGGDFEGEGEIHASAIIVSGDGQHIQPGQSATVVLAFDKYHPSCTITTKNSSGTVLRTDTIPVYGDYPNYNTKTTYTCPAGVMNSPGTYYIDFCCSDAPNFPSTFTIYVDSPPAQNDDHGDSISSATTVSVNSSTGGNINYTGDCDYFKFYAASNGNYTISTSGSTDTYGSLFSSNGSNIASNDDYNNGRNFSITQNLSGGQYYYVMVRHFSTGTGEYILNITYTKSVTGVSLDRSSMSLNAGGSTGSLAATVYPTDAANKAVTWSSSNNSVATVSSSGVVTPIGGGSAIITVCTNDGGYSASCTVTVTGLNISNVTHTSIVADSATISWNTNMSSDSIVEYGTTTSLGLSKQNSTQSTLHSIQLTGLSKGTTYYYRVKSTMNSLSAISSIYSFTTLGYDAQITTNYPPSLNIGENNDVISGNKIANCSSFYPNAKVSIQNKGIAWTSNDEIYLVVNTSAVPGILFGSLDASGKPQYQGTQAMFKVNDSNINEIILIAKADNDVTASSNKIWTQLYDKKANKYFGNKVETSISINTLGQDSFLYMRDDISANTSFSSYYNRFLDTNGTSHIAHRCFILPERGRNFAPKSSNVSYETTTEGNLYKVKVKFKWDTDIGTKYSIFKNNLPAFLVNNKYIKFISTVHMPIDWRWVSYDTNLPKGYNTHNIDFNIDGATSGSVYTSDHLECEVWTENPEKLVSGKEYYVTYTFSAKAGKTPKKGNFMQAFSIGADSSPMDADTEAYYEHGILLDTVYYSDTFYHNSEKIRNSIEKDNGEKRKRGIKVACPVIVHVYDSQGRHLGPSEDGSLELGIPGALYEVVDGETYILLDDNDTYEIRIEGYDNGMMNIKDEIIRTSEDAYIVESSTVFKNIPVQENLQASYTIQPGQSSTSINIDSNGDGREDLVKNADVIVDSSGENDRTAPTTNYDVSGTLGENNWYTSDVVLTLSASDNGGAAVAETSYIIDDGNQNTYYTPISISQEGSHTLKIGSVDTQRNVETQKILNINIDKIAPDITISAPQNPTFGDEYILNFEAFDEVSGVASCSATINGVDAFNNETIVLLKKDTVISVVSTDNAGNTSEKAITIHVDDDVPPVSTVSLKGTIGENLWYISDVIVTLDSTDIGFEGVDKTYYKINGAEPKEYTEPISITKEGSNLLEIYSVDKVGNMEEIKTAFIRIDKSLPIITEKRPEGTTYVKSIDGSYCVTNTTCYTRGSEKLTALSRK